MLKISAIIVAAGSGSRMGGEINKVFLPLLDKKVIDYSIKQMTECEEISEIVVVTRECDIEEMKTHLKDIKKSTKITVGGKTRQESVLNGLKVLSDSDYVLIHDGARALITKEIIKNAISDMLAHSASAVGVLVKDTLKETDEEGFIAKTLNREKTYQIQTPQCFDYKKILNAHEKAQKDGFIATDDCAVYEKYVGKIKITNGSYDNIKITTPEDMIIAENILKR